MRQISNRSSSACGQQKPRIALPEASTEEQCIEINAALLLSTICWAQSLNQNDRKQITNHRQIRDRQTPRLICLWKQIKRSMCIMCMNTNQAIRRFGTEIRACIQRAHYLPYKTRDHAEIQTHAH